MRQAIHLAFPLLFFSLGAWAEQGCPAGQIPAQSNGSMASCGPIPAGYYQEQPAPAPRPLGKWIKTWGAIAGDGIDNIAVSTGKLNKSDAEQDAMVKCMGASSKKCHIVVSYKNQCVSAAEPNNGGVMIVANGRSIETTGQNALSDCKKDNPGSGCKIIYQECSEPIFKSY